jgi:hypothetical protein
MSGGRGADPGGVQRVPLTTGSQHEEDRIHADPVRLAWPTAAEAMRVRVLGKMSLDQRPEFIGDDKTLSRF